MMRFKVPLIVPLEVESQKNIIQDIDYRFLAEAPKETTLSLHP